MDRLIPNTLQTSDEMQVECLSSDPVSPSVLLLSIGGKESDEL